VTSVSRRPHAAAGDRSSTPWTATITGYPVTLGRGVLGSVGEIVAATAPAHRYAVITDDTVRPLHAERVARALPAGRTILLAIPAGESQKTRETWARLTDELLANGFGRDSALVAVGGGVIGDLAGFVAATFMRGIPFVQVPTTLLAMIDASIGGKTAVDVPATSWRRFPHGTSAPASPRRSSTASSPTAATSTESATPSSPRAS
jgi:3-dehydroquinate synthetase